MLFMCKLLLPVLVQGKMLRCPSGAKLLSSSRSKCAKSSEKPLVLRGCGKGDEFTSSIQKLPTCGKRLSEEQHVAEQNLVRAAG